jgi:Ca-activated chloride channel family protein
VNDELLQKFASDTGGKYYRATREGALGEIFNDINKLETTKIDVNKFTRYSEKFSFWIWSAFVIYLLAWLLQMTWLRRIP